MCTGLSGNINKLLMKRKSDFWLTRKSSDGKKEPDGGEVELEVEEDKGH